MSNVRKLSDYRPPLEAVERKVAQLEDGFLRLANELLDATMCSGLPETELCIVMAVWRKTYGYSKKMDWISNEQLEEMIGKHLTHCSTAKTSLVRKKVLLQEGRKVGMNTNISEWETKNNGFCKTLAKPAKKTLAEVANGPSQKLLTTKDNIQKTKDKEPTIPPKGGFDGSLLREELIKLLEGKFDFDKASTLHDAVEAEIIAAGYSCIREFRVADRGDGRPGRVDLLVSDSDGDVCGIEIDRINVRDKSVVKLKQLADGFILVREGIVSERYMMNGVPVVSAHPLTSACNGITRDEAMDKARMALNFYNEITGSQCKDMKPFMTLLTPTQTRDSYTLDEICTVIKWALSAWKTRTGSLPKPANICRVTRFDGYLSDALKWSEGADRNPASCPHEKLIALWNNKFPERAVELHEWNKSRPAYQGLERIWNGKTNQGVWREVKHIDTIFNLIRKSTLVDGLHEKYWLTLDWILDSRNWAKVYEQVRREYKAAHQGSQP